MAAAAERTEYERAAVLRDKIRAIERTMESQKMAAFARTELDLLGLARQDNQAAIQLFVIRDGKMIGRDVFLLDAAREATDDEVLTSFLEQYYSPGRLDPARGLRAGGHRRDRRPRGVPRRSAAAGRSTSASRSAARSASSWSWPPATRGETLAREQARWLADQGKTLAALEELAEALGLPGPPLRIECYDISNFQGSESVGSMVVFEDGKPRSGEYRRFRIKTVQGPNDFASHQEVLRRRFRSVRTGEEGVEEARRWAMPDLVIVDGGKGQVSAAKAVLDELGLHDLPLAGLAKEREELFLPGRDRARSSCRRRRRRSTSSSACATRRTGSRSPITATCGRAGASARRSTTCRASGRSASASCSRCSARSSACATRRSSRSPPCPASGRRSRRGSRRPSRPDADRLDSEFFIVPATVSLPATAMVASIDPVRVALEGSSPDASRCPGPPDSQAVRPPSP